MITGLVRRRSLAVSRGEWQCGAVNELRELRRNAAFSQRDLAALLDVPLNTLRMWDSGLRHPPAHVVARARDALASWAKQRELLPLGELAKELGVHIRTLQAAARTGRLETHFCVRSVFGRPMRSPSEPLASSFSSRTIGALAASRCVRFPSQVFPTTTMSTSEICVGGCG